MAQGERHRKRYTTVLPFVYDPDSCTEYVTDGYDAVKELTPAIGRDEAAVVVETDSWLPYHRTNAVKARHDFLIQLELEGRSRPSTITTGTSHRCSSETSEIPIKSEVSDTKQAVKIPVWEATLSQDAISGETTVKHVLCTPPRLSSLKTTPKRSGRSSRTSGHHKSTGHNPRLREARSHSLRPKRSVIFESVEGVDLSAKPRERNRKFLRDEGQVIDVPTLRRTKHAGLSSDARNRSVSPQAKHISNNHDDNNEATPSPRSSEADVFDESPRRELGDPWPHSLPLHGLEDPQNRINEDHARLLHPAYFDSIRLEEHGRLNLGRDEEAEPPPVGIARHRSGVSPAPSYRRSPWRYKESTAGRSHSRSSYRHNENRNLISRATHRSNPFDEVSSDILDSDQQFQDIVQRLRLLQQTTAHQESTIQDETTSLPRLGSTVNSTSRSSSPSIGVRYNISRKTRRQSVSARFRSKFVEDLSSTTPSSAVRSKSSTRFTGAILGLGSRLRLRLTPRREAASEQEFGSSNDGDIGTNEIDDIAEPPTIRDTRRWTGLDQSPQI